MRTDAKPRSLAVLTSGGDAAGMNAAVRAIVRSGLAAGLDVYAVSDGLSGLVAGGDAIRCVSWEDVGGILHQGGTVLGTARSSEFLTREGRKRAARNLLASGIDALAVIGGDGSLTGAHVLWREWRDLLVELRDEGLIEHADGPQLSVVGLVGSIDNDMFGTDMTIGADTALNRITEAMDAIQSTAASHQRAFVIEVMGRNCGYLALMSAIASGADWVFIPESPARAGEWEEEMCRGIAEKRQSGSRHTLVVIAEGARDTEGNHISASQVKEAIERQLEADVRVTILGHLQRGGAPSAFDRYLGTVLGRAAVERLLQHPGGEPHVVGIREHQVSAAPLPGSLDATRAVAERIGTGDYDTAMTLRGGSFRESYATALTMMQARPRKRPGDRSLTLAILHGGGPAPGMNTAVRAAARFALDAGHTVLGVKHGFEGLRNGDIDTLDWMGVAGWVGRGGAELGVSRFQPGPEDFALVAEQVTQLGIDGLLMIGGWAGYTAAHALHEARTDFPALSVPIACMPASINNDPPGTDISIGSDTALNTIITDVDKIKQSAVASGRCFVVEVMGRDCGYLAALSGIITGAEQVYTPEEGITLARLEDDIARLQDGFRHGKRLGLVVRSENADDAYSTDFITTLFEREAAGLFDVRHAVLGHTQQGGDPTPFDRILATRMAHACVRFLVDQVASTSPASAFAGIQEGALGFTPLELFPSMIDSAHQRPRSQPWLKLLDLAAEMARPGGR